MLDPTPLFDFSRTHCIGICTVLVPANLLATLQTLILVGWRRPSGQLYGAVAIATLFALTMVFHVATWFMIGVVMVPTFVLLTLGSVCLAINAWAIAHPTSLASLLRALGSTVSLKINTIARQPSSSRAS